MYKVVLIDDEPWVLKDIKTVVDWQSFGYQIAGEATSSDDGERLLDTVRPDLLICDIKMPGMSGIELLRRRREKHDFVTTVFLTAYGDFAYAQQALQLGAYDYLLKPVERKTIEELLRGIAAHFAERDNIKNNIHLYENTKLLYDLIEAKRGDGEIKSKLDKMGLLDTSSNFAVVMLKSGRHEDETLLELMNGGFAGKDCRQLNVLVGKGKVCSIIALKDARKVEENAGLYDFCIQMQHSGLVVGVSEIISDINDFGEAYRQADVMCNQDFITGTTGIYQYRQRNKGYIEQALKSIWAINDTSGLKTILNTIPEIITAGGCNFDDFTRLYQSALERIFSLKNHHSDMPDILSKNDILSNYQDMPEAVAELEKLLDTENESKVPSHSIIQQVVEDIDKNYMQKIGLNMMAEKYFLNPFYLSQLFKKEVGTSFTNYLIDVRLRKAVDLIKNQDLTLYQVSNIVGYNDYVHFSKIFRKYMGLSPNEFRKKIM